MNQRRRIHAATLLFLAVAVRAAPAGAPEEAAARESGAASVTIEAEDRRWLTGNDLFIDLMDILPQAERRILVVMFLASSSGQAEHPVRRLIDELKAAHARGVDVLVILDDLYMQKNEIAYGQLRDAGIDVRWDPSGALMHTKLVVADETVWVGSANWTASALTGGNIETTLRITNKALADRLYDVRKVHMGNGVESRALLMAGRAILAEAAAILAGDMGGMARRNLAASGLDAEALVAAGVGVMAGDPAIFRTRTLARMGAGTGWARWGYPPFRENTLLLPTKSGDLLAVDATRWTVIEGNARDMVSDPRLNELRRRLRDNEAGA